MESNFNELLSEAASMAESIEANIDRLTAFINSINESDRPFEELGRISVNISSLLVSITRKYNNLMKVFNIGRAQVCAALEDSIRQKEELRRQMVGCELVDWTDPRDIPVMPIQEEGWTVVRKKARQTCWHTIPGVSAYPAQLPSFTFRKTPPRWELLPILHYETAKEFHASPHVAAFIREYNAIAVHPRILGERWSHLGDFVFPNNHEIPQYVRQFDPGKSRTGPTENTSFFVDPMQRPSRHGRCFTLPLRYVKANDHSTDTNGAIRIGATRNLMRDALEISTEDWLYFRDFVWHMIVVYNIADLVRRHPHYTWCENCRQKYKF